MHLLCLRDATAGPAEVSPIERLQAELTNIKAERAHLRHLLEREEVNTATLKAEVRAREQEIRILKGEE